MVSVFLIEPQLSNFKCGCPNGSNTNVGDYGVMKSVSVFINWSQMELIMLVVIEMTCNLDLIVVLSFLHE